MSRFILAVVTAFIMVPSIEAKQELNKEGSRSEQEQAAQGDQGIAITFQKWRFSFKLPSEKWLLMERQENVKSDSLASFMYKREGILDREGRKIEPVIGMIFEQVSRDVNLIWYETVRRPREWGFKLEKGFTHQDGTIDLKLAIGWLGRYKREGFEHTVKMVCAKDEEIAVRVIMDSTTDVFSQVEKEFDYTLKSLKFIPSEDASDGDDSVEKQHEKQENQKE